MYEIFHADVWHCTERSVLFNVSATIRYNDDLDDDASLNRIISIININDIINLNPLFVNSYLIIIIKY